MQLSLLSIISVALVAASQVAAKAQNGFIGSCTGLSSQTATSCSRPARTTSSDSTSIDLNQCVENFAGTLECATNGNFANSCSSCSLQDTDILSCNCGSGTTLKDLNDCVSNNNGQLTCP
ncbi:hypothetical protein A0H81_02737 [Grifola frondosa]|uniref:Cyanovirin-N domain-containing protein n=1 Tax=Grifola frondosa TaxID=5627 RepID=A0A1C7MMW5_GRIFR|nr:hypothetical protein A0H81_02737 [Grifola frondosa]